MHSCACFGKWRFHLALVQAALTVVALNLSVSNQALQKAAVKQAARESKMWLNGKKYENAGGKLLFYLLQAGMCSLGALRSETSGHLLS